jgi:GH15 family glucan-1,4-alpha-glucosidase
MLAQHPHKLGSSDRLVASKYDSVARHQLGNFPQALTHVALINTARKLSRGGRS